MPEARIDGLNGLIDRLDKVLEDFPQLRRELLERMGPALREEVLRGLGPSDKVAGWQTAHMGSGGGYVAVRPKANTYQVTQGGKRYAVGYVTNAIEGGHRPPSRRGSSRPDYRYRPRHNVAAVPGKWMYDAARESLPAMAEAEARSLLEQIGRTIEGGSV